MAATGWGHQVTLQVANSIFQPDKVKTGTQAPVQRHGNLGNLRCSDAHFSQEIGILEDT